MSEIIKIFLIGISPITLFITFYKIYEKCKRKDYHEVNDDFV